MNLINSQDTLFIAADHAGFKLKEDLKQKFADLNHPITDLTPEAPSPTDDYPPVAIKLAKEITDKKARGILVCGSGNGICMAANKIPGIRAAVGYNTQSAKWAKTDEDANVLCLAGAVLSPEYAMSIIRHWLETPFTAEERHFRRILELSKLDQ